MAPETDDARLWRFARFAAGTIMMRWFLDYPLPDVTIDVEGMHWTELEAMDEHMLTLHKILITCAGIMAACPVGVLPLAEQDNAIADDLRQWITPDFILEYQDEIHDAKRWRAQGLAKSQDELTVDPPEMYTQQQVLDYFMDEALGFVDDHQEVISCLTEMLCEQHELSHDDATRYLNEWAIR